jgi:diguanylate cyclase (GGDEF)-like protein
VYLRYYIETMPQLGSYVRLIDNLPIFREAAKGEGHINMPPDVDGVVRHAILNIPFGDAGHWQLSFLMACDWLGVPREGITVSPGNIVQLKPAAGEMIAIPVDRNAAMIIDWYGPWRQCFAHCTLAEIFEAAEGAEGRHRDFSLENLEGRICLVGVTAPGTFDAMRTPFEHLAPSIAIHANILSQILQRRFMNALSRRSNVALIVLLGVASSFIVPRLKPSAAAAATLVGCAGAIALFIITVERYRLQVIVVHPVAALLLTYFAMSIRREITVSMERARLQHLATHDGLTGLCVVEHVRLLLDTEIAESRRKGRPLALVMADIDRFKDYNDRYGHQAGDFILREIARILQSSCRELDIAGRYGGEEFIIVLPDTRLGEAREVAERIRAAVERYPFTYGGERHAVTLSLGAAELHRMDSSDDLIRRADEALYQAKREGRNRVHVRESGRNKGIPITLE